MATVGLHKRYILDKYFTELQKFWETERKLHGEPSVALPLHTSATKCLLGIIIDSAEHASAVTEISMLLQRYFILVY